MIKRILCLSLLIAAFVSIFGPTLQTNAVTGSEWKAGNIIDDGVFTNTNDMSIAQIQAFLESKLGTNGYDSIPGKCDTNGTRNAAPFNSSMTRGEYARSLNRPDKFTCLTNYYEVPKLNPGPEIPANNYGGAPIPAGAKSAAHLIWDAAQRYSISPRVLLVTLEKESAGPLTRDDWPFHKQFVYAMGAHCPDSGPGGAANCDTNWAGFSLQIMESAALYRSYLDNMTKSWWSHKKPYQVNDILWNIKESNCGSSPVYIENKATAALYTYTPYQPNSAALNNLYGTGDRCSAYGNRNFWRIFHDWFGSTYATNYAWSVATSNAYLDANRTQPYSNSPVIDTTPGTTSYITIQARNIGYETWTKSVVHLGTTYPMDRSSVFKNNTWLSPQRIEMQESSVAPGEVATFTFSMTAPTQTGTYVEHFSLVADGIKWMNDPNLYYTVNVTTPVGASNTKNTNLLVGQFLKPGERLMSPDSQTILSLLPNGNVVAYVDFKPVWNNGVNNSDAQVLVLQSDGNLVEYDSAGRPLWSSRTSGGSTLALQTDGNIVLYSGGGTPLWSTNTGTAPDHLSKVNTFIPPNGVMYPGQFMQTADRKHTLILQPGDGNLVEYDSAGRPIWSSNTYGTNNVAVMQGDGNMVIYDGNGRALWWTGTAGAGNSFTLQENGALSITNGNNAIAWSNKVVLQAGQYIQTADRAYTLVLQASDGNLVEYNSAGRAVWSSGTSGVGNSLVMQGDGNLVIYNRAGRALWSTRTNGSGNVMALQSDGNVVIYGGNGRGALWTSR